ncbi:MAG: class I SAM-dependent methyltransferase [Acidobacteriota bacterium]|nr:class I SAM-dependent methyltransferase [Acidobacteriota bacterium]
MPSKLPDLTEGGFRDELLRLAPEALSPSAIRALYHHYQELARWNRRLSLVGPGTAAEIVSRHYVEALAALPLIPAGTKVAVDIGSGAGFPGMILKAALPEVEMTLVEAQERKWLFLLTAARRASLPCRCLNVRIASPLPRGLPERFDLLTTRALKLEAALLQELASRLTSTGCMLLWVGKDDPELPPELSRGESIGLPGSDRRRILKLHATQSVFRRDRAAHSAGASNRATNR